jgi:hypothetical protein
MLLPLREGCSWNGRPPSKPSKSEACSRKKDGSIGLKVLQRLNIFEFCCPIASNWWLGRLPYKFGIALLVQQNALFIDKSGIKPI